jgi:hypothetical protein
MSNHLGNNSNSSNNNSMNTTCLNNNHTKKKRSGNNNMANKRMTPNEAAQYLSHFSQTAASLDRDQKYSPEEVKALMGMFAEMMGLSTNKKSTSSSPSSSSSFSSSVSFMFGSKENRGTGEWASSSAFAAAAKAAVSSMHMRMPTNEFMEYCEAQFEKEEHDEEDDDDDDDDEDGCDDDEGFNIETQRRFIDPSEWKDLEQVARDEKREEEAREMKAAKKREKKQRKKERLRKEASTKAAEAAIRKQEKLVTSWKSRVVAACQANDSIKLQGLLGESPFSRKADDCKEHIESLLQNCVSKSKDMVEVGVDCRLKMAEFVHGHSITYFFAISVKSGRNSVHSACLVGDYHFLQFVLERKDSSDVDDEVEKLDIDMACHESGFSPIHYAILSGSKEVIQLLIMHGCKLETKSNPSITSINGEAITAVELALTILDGNQEHINSQGNAIISALEGHISDWDTTKQYLTFLCNAIGKMRDILENGHIPLKETKKDNTPEIVEEINGVSSKGKKKKKKKKQEPKIVPPVHSRIPPGRQEDPMITALLGMGFSREQIDEAAIGCGGIDYSTADDLVMWIIAKESGEDLPQISEHSQTPDQPEVLTVEKDILSEEQIAEANRLEEARKAEEALLMEQRFAKQREELRRRNREWNNREQARQAREKLAIAQSHIPVVLHKPDDADLEIVSNSTSKLDESAFPSAMESNHRNGQVVKNAPFKTVGKPSGSIKILSRPKLSPDSSKTNLSKNFPPGMEAIRLEFPPIGTSSCPEDGTVSSLGSAVIGHCDWLHETETVNPAVQASVHEIHNADVEGQAPIFTNSPSLENLSYENSSNPLGQIRATAKAFVPSTFKPPPGLTYAGIPPGIHHEFSTFTNLANDQKECDPLHVTTSILPGAFEPPNVSQSLGHSGLSGFDSLHIEPPSTSYSSAPSAMSSVTGLSTADEVIVNLGAPHSSTLGLGGWQSSLVPTTSVSDPLLLGLSAPDPTSLWGGSTEQIIGAPIGGLALLDETLPSLNSFGSTFVPFLLDRKEERKDEAVTLAGGWGASNSSSIW